MGWMVEKRTGVLIRCEPTMGGLEAASSSSSSAASLPAGLTQLFANQVTWKSMGACYRAPVLGSGV